MLSLTACGLFSVTASGGCSLGVECWLLRHLGFSSYGPRAWLLCGLWDLPGPGIEPVSLASAGGFFTTELQRSPRHPAFAFGSSEVAVGTSRDLLPRIRPNCVCTQLSLAPYGFFIFCCWEGPLSGCKSCSEVAQIPVCVRAVRYFFQVKGESISCSVVSDSLGPCGL